MFQDKKVEEQLRILIREIIRYLPTGPYRLSDALGEAWSLIDAKTDVGIWFKRSVEAGDFPGVRACGKTVENHQLYSINKEPV